ncbi:hypothetical protein GCM10027066_16100 [Dyella jejuensis]
MRAFDDGVMDAIEIGRARVTAALAQAFGHFGDDGMQTHFILQPGASGVGSFANVKGVRAMSGLAGTSRLRQ